MRAKDMYREIRYSHRRPSCRRKARYFSEVDAMAAASQHEWEFVCTGMNVYWCSQHSCWHIGHRDKNLPVILKLMEDVLWFQAWARRN